MTSESPPEPTATELEEAERELKELSDTLQAAPVDRFLSLLLEWDAYESQRIGAEETYRLRTELLGLNQEQKIREYALAKRAVLGIEVRLGELLLEMGEKDRETLLAGQPSLVARPGIQRFIFVKPELGERLKRRVGLSSVDGSGVSKSVAD